MKNFFVEVKYRGDLEFPEWLIEKLPSKLVICSVIQYLDYLPQLQRFLEQHGKTVEMYQSNHGQYPGQILGCDVFNAEFDCDAFLYLGDGEFHPTALLYRNGKPVYTLEPRAMKLDVLTPDYLDRMRKRKNVQLIKFFQSQHIGLLVTLKPGQNQFLAVKRLEQRLRDMGKTVHTIVADNINEGILDNFNFVQSWVNTGCPRIGQDFPCVNMRDLFEAEVFDGKHMQF